MLNQSDFFEKYKVESEFKCSGLEWSDLEQIYDDYCGRQKEVEKCAEELEKYIRENIGIQVHSMRFRWKDPEHLIEKIIRKRGKEQSRKYKGINVSNYREIIRDLVGARILVLAKEDWEMVFDRMMMLFPDKENASWFMAEKPIAYIRYGDRNIFKNKIATESSNKGYRSQHYVVKFKGYYCEIQVRTLTEEVYGEFDHRVKYPYRDDNKFLLRYTKTLSQLLGSVDEFISTCFQMNEEGWNMNDHYFEEDNYFDWTNISQKKDTVRSVQEEQICDILEDKIEMGTYVNRIMLRKD